MKATPKSCSCRHCTFGKRTKRGQHQKATIMIDLKWPRSLKMQEQDSSKISGESWNLSVVAKQKWCSLMVKRRAYTS